MEIRIIKTKQQYRRYLKEVHRLVPLDPDPRTAEGARLELLAKLVEDYEKERFKFRKPDPIEAILFRMEEQGLRQTDIAEIVGGKNRASEVLSRKRPLTLAMIRALHEKLGIPSELLIQEPRAEYRVERKPRKTKEAAPEKLTPTEIYDRKRIREFDEAEADLEKVLRWKKKRAG
jgi:HTH-type transcriptional regulator/antitoxin HigA